MVLALARAAHGVHMPQEVFWMECEELESSFGLSEKL